MGDAVARTNVLAVLRRQGPLLVACLKTKVKETWQHNRDQQILFKRHEGGAASLAPLQWHDFRLLLLPQLGGSILQRLLLCLLLLKEGLVLLGVLLGTNLRRLQRLSLQIETRGKCSHTRE